MGWLIAALVSGMLVSCGNPIMSECAVLTHYTPQGTFTYQGSLPRPIDRTSSGFFFTTVQGETIFVNGAYVIRPCNTKELN